jgi:Na+/H+ antiporter NhaC
MLILLVAFFIIGAVQIFRGFCATFDADLKKMNEANESLWHYLYIPVTILGYIAVIVVLYFGYCYLTN